MFLITVSSSRHTEILCCCMVTQNFYFCPYAAHGYNWHIQNTYDSYIHTHNIYIWKIQLTNVGLAHACPNYQCPINNKLDAYLRALILIWPSMCMESSFSWAGIYDQLFVYMPIQTAWSHIVGLFPFRSSVGYQMRTLIQIPAWPAWLHLR